MMRSPLEKARNNPESMKARILAVARRIFGEYGFHGTTTRMIAKEVGIDISTLHYHWGDKKDLYEAVVIDMNNDLGKELLNLEKIVHGSSLEDRMNISLNRMTDYLFEHPEISNLVLARYFSKIRPEVGSDFKIPEFTGDIARGMGLTQDAKHTPPRAAMEILSIMNGIHNFVSGENFFREVLNLERKKYINLVKKTLIFVLIPAFVIRKEKTTKNGSSPSTKTIPKEKKKSPVKK
jgi:TetR/AcrR family transcriptional regulator, regulator of cefoperazone and chloramphenicol sensitivity